MTAMFGVCTHLVLLLVVSVLRLLGKLNALFKACSSLVLLLCSPFWTHLISLLRLTHCVTTMLSMHSSNFKLFYRYWWWGVAYIYINSYAEVYWYWYVFGISRSRRFCRRPRHLKTRPWPLDNVFGSRASRPPRWSKQSRNFSKNTFIGLIM